MNHTKFHSILKIFLVISIGCLSFGVGAAQAAAPANDDFDYATQIAQLPFSEAIDTTEATLASDDPLASCGGIVYGKTVWYSVAPAYDMGISISKGGSSYDADIYVFTGSRGLLAQVAGACDEYYNDIRFAAYSGTVYYIMVAARNWYEDPSGGILTLNITELPLPPNDDFANAVNVSSLPFVHTADTELATREANEPDLCNPSGETVWYAFTPASSGTYTARATFAGGFGVLAAYTGDELESLTEEACSQNDYEALVTLPMQAGTTYYFQAGPVNAWWNWTLTFSVDLTPPPNVDFYYSISQPSKFDTVEFYNYSSDPGRMGLSAYWDFGDGTTSTEWSTSNHYLTDGDYTIRLTITSEDGRSTTDTRPISVRTHDIAITRFVVPQSASAGQTRQITVYVNNKVYDESVEVQLWKSTPGGYNDPYVQVGSLTLFVPHRTTNRAIPFAFSYTFTPEDAAIGKVTFKAVANIQDARDALPADNEAIALPTKVGR